MDAAPIPLETLLAHREWVRSVARAVVRDPNAADDVEQETWLAALRSPPRRATSLRGWFGAVVRSRARRIGRTDARRERRELAASRDEATAPASHLVEIADTHRCVVQAVVELDEPYRTAILLRYFEGLSIEDVAARTASPLETTRSRLKRGIAKLRERLSREFDTRDRRWELALVPLLGRVPESSAAPIATAATTGGALVGTKTIAVAAGVLLVAGGLWWGTSSARDAGSPEVSAGGVADASAVVWADPRVRPARAVRNAADTADVPANAPPAPPGPVRITTPGDRPVEERLADKVGPLELLNEGVLVVLGRIAQETQVPVVVSAEAAEAIEKSTRPVQMHLNTAATGLSMLEGITGISGLAFEVEADRVVIVPLDRKWDRLRPIVVPPVSPPLPTLTVTGRVVDAEGVTVAGADVVCFPAEFRRVTTDVAGRYEIKLRRPYGALEARAVGHRASLSVDVTGQAGDVVPLDLALRGPGGSVSVQVTSEEGPRARAFVRLGAEDDRRTELDGRPARERALRVLTDARGSAAFDSVGVGPATIVVKLPGYEDAAAAVTIEGGKDTSIALKLVKKPSLKERVEKARVTCRFTELALYSVVADINRLTSVNVVVLPDVPMSRLDAHISLTLDDQPLATALREICTQIGGVDYEVVEADDIVVIRAIKK